MKTFSFTFARGGSKGLKDKNIIELAGTPLVGHAVLQARSISQIEKHFVSTDSHQIAAIAESFGAEIIIRPQDLATDNAVEWHAWQHAVKYVMDKYGKFDQFVSLPCTSPLRNNSDIIKCISKDIQSGQIVISYTDAHRNPWFNLLKIKDSSAQLLEPVCKEENVKYFRRQDAPSCYDMTTVAYATSPSTILQYQNLFELDFVGVYIPPERALDIDTSYDFILARALFESKSND